MKKLWYPILVLAVMLILSLLYFTGTVNDLQLKTGLVICTILWFAGLALLDWVGKRRES